jgi:hypothetical protein
MNHFKEKLIEGTMFDIKLMESFYTIEHTETVANDDVKNAYYKFVNDFCSNVSSVWKKYLKEQCLYIETATFVQFLTRSDEAFAYWLILCLYEKCAADALVIKTEGRHQWNQARKKGKAGKHDSNTKFDDYINIYNKVTALRDNEKAYAVWQQYFFEKFFQKKGLVKKAVSKDENKEKEANQMFDIPESYD